VKWSISRAAAGIAAAAFALSAGNSARASWQLAWADEFEGTNVDAGKWAYDIGNGSGGWGNNELEYYTSRATNVYVADGFLHIVARKESYKGFNYTSAKLKTQGLFSARYGRFEFRVKLPQGVGYWPALWLMPQTSTYGGWAASGEVDIVENKGRYPTNVMGTLHFGAPYPGQDQSHGPSYNFTGGDSVTNFHVYALEWTTNQFRWYVDGALYQTQTSWWSSGGAYPAPFDIPFYIIMNLAVGGNFDGNPDGSTVFPGEMQVDYVRVYNWTNPPPPALLLRVPLTDPPGSFVTAGDTNGGGAEVTLQLTGGAGAPLDCHGAAGSGVAGAVNGSRALDFTSNGASQPGIPGPLASASSPGLGFGGLSNFVVSLWFRQNVLMATGANIGPRLFVLGAGVPPDTGAANSIGLKFQTAGTLYFQFGATTVPCAISLQTNNWVFFAAVYDGSTLSLYTGTDGAAASLKTNVIVNSAVQFGADASLFIGNRQDWSRSFNGLLADFRLYAGAADTAFVENIRLLPARPPWGLTAAATNGAVVLNWGSALGATNYNVQRARVSGGPYETISPVGLVAPPFLDATATDDGTYYYIVSALNPAGAGAPSAEASVTVTNASATPVLQIVSSNNVLNLFWAKGSLQSATNVAGPWVDVPDAAPPSFEWSLAGPQRFFRVK
jgi:beta-glucanase (GH16 family)